jgi:hypothetical protein
VPDIDRRVLIAAPIIALIIFALGFGVGSLISGGSGDAQATGGENSTTTAIASDAGTGSTLSPGGDSTAEAVVGDATAAIIPPKTDAADIPEYGTPQDRDDLITGLTDSGVSGGSREAVLATADRICYNLERLEAQDRSPAFAVRVVWNESLAELEPEDLGVFSAVFSATPFYLCPTSLDYSREVAYWLGY